MINGDARRGAGRVVRWRGLCTCRMETVRKSILEDEDEDEVLIRMMLMMAVH